MSDWLVSVAGTPQGARLALVLALCAAFLHAAFGALQKGRHDPWLTRGAMDASYAAMAAPFALFVVPWPEPHMWPIFAVMVVIHLIYKLLQSAAYQRGAYTVVYPVVRGSSPLFTAIGAGLVFGEHFTPLQWGGLAVLIAGIGGLARENLRRVEADPVSLRRALWLALATGVMVATYTTYDAWGIRATADPFTFLAWFFFLDGILIPPFTFLAWRRNPARPAAGPLMARGVLGAFVAFGSFGAIMLATRLDHVGEAAVLRETSVVFAALIGWLVLGENIGARRSALIGLIALGALISEFGG